MVSCPSRAGQKYKKFLEKCRFKLLYVKTFPVVWGVSVFADSFYMFFSGISHILVPTVHWVFFRDSFHIFIPICFGKYGCCCDGSKSRISFYDAAVRYRIIVPYYFQTAPWRSCIIKVLTILGMWYQTVWLESVSVNQKKFRDCVQSHYRPPHSCN